MVIIFLCVFNKNLMCLRCECKLLNLISYIVVERYLLIYFYCGFI